LVFEVEEDDDFWTGPEHFTKELHEALRTQLTQEIIDEDVQAIKSYQLLPTTSDVDEQVPQSEDADESADHLLTPEEINSLTDLGEAKMHLLRYEKAYRNITQACTKRRRDESTERRRPTAIVPSSMSHTSRPPMVRG